MPHDGLDLKCVECLLSCAVNMTNVTIKKDVSDDTLQ